MVFPALPRVSGSELHEVLNVLRQKSPPLLHGVLRDFGVFRFGETFWDDGHNVEAALAEHFSQERTNVFIEQKTNRRHWAGPPHARWTHSVPASWERRLPGGAV